MSIFKLRPDDSEYLNMTNKSKIIIIIIINCSTSNSRDYKLKKICWHEKRRSLINWMSPLSEVKSKNWKMDENEVPVMNYAKKRVSSVRANENMCNIQPIFNGYLTSLYICFFHFPAINFFLVNITKSFCGLRLAKRVNSRYVRVACTSWPPINGVHLIISLHK